MPQHTLRTTEATMTTTPTHTTMHCPSCHQSHVIRISTDA